MIYTKPEIREHLLQILIDNREEFVEIVERMQSQRGLDDLEHFFKNHLCKSPIFKRYKIYADTSDIVMRISFSAEFKIEDVTMYGEDNLYDVYINIPYIEMKSNLLSKIRNERLTELLSLLD